ncbi:MAG: hypothetical protein IJ215_00405 [Clostridia bacterium]|nr:hypothetical protein [Clostridia bacterium]
MTKKIILLFITVFSFSAGVVAGNNFMDYIFRDYNLSVVEAANNTETAKNTSTGGKVYTTSGSIKQEENSSTNDEKSPNSEIEETNDNEVIIANK